MKNRYGMDGMTFSAKANTSTGHFEVSDRVEEDDDETPTSSQQLPFNTFDSLDKKELRNKFFELGN
jgi:hypothetical protein